MRARPCSCALPPPCWLDHPSGGGVGDTLVWQPSATRAPLWTHTHIRSGGTDARPTPSVGRRSLPRKSWRLLRRTSDRPPTTPHMCRLLAEVAPRGPLGVSRLAQEMSPCSAAEAATNKPKLPHRMTFRGTEIASMLLANLGPERGFRQHLRICQPTSTRLG